MKKLFLISIITIMCVTFSQSIEFTLRTIYLKADKDMRDKLTAYNKLLEDKLNTYDWKFPHNDFEGISTNINLNIEKSTSEGKFEGMITISSGLITKNRVSVPLKKDIYYNEQDVVFSLDVNLEPDLDSKVPSSIENILRFYGYLILGENFDRLSYTDQKNFKLEGEYYYLQIYEFENLLNSAQERKNWNKRLDIINDIKLNNNIRQRKLNAFIYNATYFINTGRSKRAEYFVEPIYSILSSNEKYDQETFFKNNYFALAEIFALVPDTTYINFLIDKDPAHKSIYSGKLPKISPKVNEEKSNINRVPQNDLDILKR
ncbi:MAG: DUF4835 family protein [Candidatus Delongbacteria bacterium]|nr:DUF4835 family protein [Candidatus Delongbacteria bacterium]